MNPKFLLQSKIIEDKNDFELDMIQAKQRCILEKLEVLGKQKKDKETKSFLDR